MKKTVLAVAGVFVLGILFTAISVKPVYAAKEALWEENFDAMEDGEETGLSPFNADVAMEVQSKIINGEKGKALKITPKEGVDYGTWKMFGITKDMTFPNENASLSFSYYASGIASLNVMTNDRTIPENCDMAVSGLVQNKWTKVVLRISKFKVKSPKGKIKGGDEFRYIYITSNVDPSKPLNEQFFVLDDIKLSIGEDDKKDEGKKEDVKKDVKKK